MISHRFQKSSNTLKVCVMWFVPLSPFFPSLYNSHAEFLEVLKTFPVLSHFSTLIIAFVWKASLLTLLPGWLFGLILNTVSYEKPSLMTQSLSQHHAYLLHHNYHKLQLFIFVFIYCLILLEDRVLSVYHCHNSVSARMCSQYTKLRKYLLSE